MAYNLKVFINETMKQPSKRYHHCAKMDRKEWWLSDSSKETEEISA